MTNKGALAIAGNAVKKAAERVKAIESTEAVTYESADLDALAAVIVDTEAASSVRRAALNHLLVAQFANPAFPKWRKKFITMLLKLMADPTPEFAEAALGHLVKLKVPAAQTKLLNILRSPAEAPISTAKALQLLRYDVHSDAYPIARGLAVDAETDDPTRQAALRLLAADPTAAGLFEKLLKTKEETPEIRRVCAAALNNLKPKAYQKFAQESVLDDDEHNAVRAQSLTALATLGDSELLAGNDRLTDKVKELRAGAAAAVKKAARQYLAKISDE